MKECHTPAISIAVIENFEISEVYTYGEKRRGKKEKVTADTLFQAGSISKPVFAVAVMRLVERGILDLDTGVSRREMYRWRTPCFVAEVGFVVVGTLFCLS